MSKANKQENKNTKAAMGMRSGGRRPRGMPVVKPKNFKGTMMKLWKYFSREKKLLLLLLLFVVITAGIGLSVPYLIGRAIDTISNESGIIDFNILGIIVVVILVGYLTTAIITFFQGWIMAGISQRIVKSLRTALFDKLQVLPISYFDSHAHGETMSRLANDIENVSTTISQSTIQLMSSGITIIGSFIMMLILSPLLTFASIITIPLVLLVTKVITKRTKVFFKEQQRKLGKLNGHIEETISGILVVKAFNREEEIIKEFDDVNKELRNVGINAQVWSGFIMPLMNVIKNIGFTAVAGVGGVLAVRDLITIGVIASFISYSKQFVRPLNDFASIFNTLQSAVAGAERVFEVLEEAEEPKDLPKAKDLKKCNGHVRFENVSFGYQSDIPVLRDISFDTNGKNSIALVGPTGAGKTTIVNLLARFYDVTKGRIMIDGLDIREYTRDSLRKTFGIVLQDTYLFADTIKENIRYGRLDASDEEIKEAAIMANAHSFIKHMSDGYETKLSERGSNLSEGQRQLIAIARAILSNPSILILDEATSNVDTRTELHIQEAMLKLMEDRTSFIIAHRLSTIRNADVIMVIDNGGIVESGDHESLINQRGIYYEMYNNQFENTRKVI
ncbi:ABC transporter ATP-binding protein [Sporosalibacterium faouarense]|uniref:ABC transporter ATP-binding protein n=1 Tax=Sporosalibacterium faouarense TaxID=516123 RepID=UPI00192CB06A|nr:ABC transporter ATP-binding protein [Sporosalibacterium faouarense]